MSVPPGAMFPDPSAGGLAAAQQGIALANGEEPSISAEDKELLRQLSERVKSAREFDKKPRDQWPKWRAMVRGETPAGQEPWAVRANLIGSIVEVLLAFLYAKNPDVSAAPTKGIQGPLRDKYREVGNSIEIVVSRLWRDARLKSKAKRWLRAAMTVGFGWLRAHMQTRTERDSVVQAEIQDLQSNVARYEALMAQAQECDAGGNSYSALIAQAKSQLVALEAKLERVIATGLVIDVMAAEDVVVATECTEIENYLDAPWIAVDFYKTFTEALAMLGKHGLTKADLKGATLFKRKPRDGAESTTAVPAFTDNGTWAPDSENETPDGYLRITELWHKDDGVVYTLIDGLNEKWGRPKYAPRTGSRWYNLFCVMFHPSDQARFPTSDVQELESLQEEYSSTRSNWREHRERCIPGTLVDAEAFTGEEIRKMNEAERGEYIPVKRSSKEPFAQAFHEKKYPMVDPALYDPSPIRYDMEQVSGAQDAQRGSVAVEKTATEAKIQESGFGARTGARRDCIDDALSELAQWTAEVALQVITPDQALRYIGPGNPWVNMTPEEAMTMFTIDVKAGSTGKPRASSDRETWATLMPLIAGVTKEIEVLRAGGPQNEWMVKPREALLRETFKRLDDPADIDAFMPKPSPEQMLMAQLTGAAGGGMPGAPMGAGAPPLQAGEPPRDETHPPPGQPAGVSA